MAFFFINLKKKKQFTTAVAACDNITISKLSENLTNYIIWKLHTPRLVRLNPRDIYILYRSSLELDLHNKKQKQNATHEDERKKSIEFYKARRHCRILLYCRKMPTEGFKWLSKRQPYLIYSAIVVQKAANEPQDERDGKKN